jgi:hypothetical protein
LARASWSKSPSTIGTELIAAAADAQAAERSDRPRRAASPSGRSSTEAGKTPESHDQLLGRGHADEDRLREASIAALSFTQRRVRLVADHELVRVAVWVLTWRANQA